MTYWDHQAAAQALMVASGIDGWLLMDFRGTNPFMARVLGTARRLWVTSLAQCGLDGAGGAAKA